jgi:CRISPR-associated endonuclease/helicase Cas3
LIEQEGEWKLSAGLLERATLLSFALHDLGKLDERWQKWAIEYQELIGESVPNFLIAHTHWDESNPKHKEAQKIIKTKKPKTHAGEGADAGARILWEALRGNENPGLYKAAFTAIARHHSPFLEGANSYCLHTNAKSTLNEILIAIGGQTWQDWSKFLRDSPNEEPDIQKRLLESYPDSPLIWWWFYFLIVRNLRLCDGMSQEK